MKTVSTINGPEKQGKNTSNWSVWVITCKSKLVKDSVSEFGPLVDEHLGRISPRLDGVVPRGQEICRNCHEIAGLGTPAALLGVRASAMEGMINVNTYVRGLKKFEKKL